MATNGEPGDAPSSGSSSRQRMTLTSLMLAHKRVCAGSIALLLVFVVVTFVTTVSDPRRQALSDAATCSAWAAATPGQQTAYSHLYINEYGAFPNTARDAAAVQKAIDKACVRASYLGEADDVSVLASLRHAF